jgi:hypothetical protein
VKLLFDSLDALLTELRDAGVQVVRVSPALAIEAGPRMGGVPHAVVRVLVTAALDEQRWAEWRLWIGQTMADPARNDVDLPAWLSEARDQALARISRRLDDAGFLIREGIVTHDAGTMDSFRL